MNIKILCVGKLKESYWNAAEAEYSKRLSRYCHLTSTEIKEERISDNPSRADEESVKAAEGRRILKTVKSDEYVIALDVFGKSLSSEKLADKLANMALSGKSNAVFIIGGSLGLSEEVLERADYSLSFSAMTFPHQLMRIILLEQIYRSFKINSNETYHK